MRYLFIVFLILTSHQTAALPIRFDCNGAIFQGELSHPEEGVLTLHSVIEGSKAYLLKLAPAQNTKNEFLNYLLQPDAPTLIGKKKAQKFDKKYFSLPRMLFDGKAVESFNAYYNDKSLTCEAQGAALPEKLSNDELMKVLSVEFKDQFNSREISNSPWKSYIKAALLPPKHEQAASQLASDASNELNTFFENDSYIVVREGMILGYVVSFKANQQSHSASGGALYLDFKGNIVANHIGR